MEDAESIRGLLIALDIAIPIAAISAFFWILRIKYEYDVKASKKHPQGRMIAEFWKEDGRRPKFLVDIATNGWEVKAPEGQAHRCPRYFFLKSSVGKTKYPTQPLLPFSFLQVDAPIVSWIENCPEAIDPTKDGHKIEVTAEMHDLVRDTDSLSAGQALNDEMAKTQQELASALKQRINPTILYVLLIVCTLGTVGAAIFAYQAFNALQGGG